MAKIDMIHYYELPIEDYLRIIFEPVDEEVNDLTDLPNVQEREELERFEDDKIIRTVVRYSAIGMIPPAARKILKPHMLSWLEHSTYDKAGRFWQWHIEPHYLKEIFTCKGKMTLHEEGPRTKRISKGVLKIKFPIVGQLVEQFILKELEKNFDAEIVMFNDMLKRTGKAG